MFVITVSGKYMHCTDGSIYTYSTLKEALIIVDICYGLSSIGKSINLRYLFNNPNGRNLR